MAEQCSMIIHCEHNTQGYMFFLCTYLKNERVSHVTVRNIGEAKYTILNVHQIEIQLIQGITRQSTHVTNSFV
jgi:hypothetical protein